MSRKGLPRAPGRNRGVFPSSPWPKVKEVSVAQGMLEIRYYGKV